ncbi:hypothetical protein BLA29_004647 [Euroglyphus maynei]|uniref:Uncharacterized protein n=1 Tax=Euroglyphus maynei TaxID=6958 RepID=A0A1Y3BF60_EURMA|nr:hypothetical protein BLA29_004647 [Euroglyphus maynei]
MYSSMIVDFNPEIYIEIEADDDDWKFMNIDNLFMIAVHKANDLPSLDDFKEYSVVNNNRLDIGFTLTKFNILQKYYCKTYELDQDLYQKYRNRDECIRICVLGIYFVSNFTCYYYFPPVILEHLYGLQKQMTICPHDQQNYSRYLETRNLCEYVCPAECEQEKLQTYSLSTKISYKSTGKTYTQIRIRFSTYPIESIRYRLLIDSDEQQAIIGGHMGLWLGLSLMSLTKIYVKEFSSKYFAVIV